MGICESLSNALLPKMHQQWHLNKSIKTCHYLNKNKECLFEKLGCMFDHALAGICRFVNKCSIDSVHFKLTMSLMWIWLFKIPTLSITKVWCWTFISWFAGSKCGYEDQSNWCEECDFDYYNTEDLEIHENIYHNTSCQQKCDHCDYKVNNEGIIIIIINYHENVHNINPNIESYFLYWKPGAPWGCLGLVCILFVYKMD